MPAEDSKKDRVKFITPYTKFMKGKGIHYEE